MRIAPINFQGTKGISPKTNSISQPQFKEVTKQNTNNALQNALLGLAILGAAALTSCEEAMDINKTNSNEAITDVSENDSLKTNLEKFDGMLKDIGLLKEKTNSICDAKSISFYNEKGDMYFVKPTRISKDTIMLKKMQLHPDLTGNISKSIITSQNGDIFATNISQNDTTKFMYKKNKDNSYTEFNEINGFYVENAKLSKNQYGELVKTKADGTEIIYDGISNNREMPDKVNVSFDVSIDSGYKQ